MADSMEATRKVIRRLLHQPRDLQRAQVAWVWIGLWEAAA